MYQDCLCTNEFNYYGNPNIWQDQATHSMWDSNKLTQPFPMNQSRFLFSPNFDPHLPNMMPTEDSMDQEPSQLGSAMSFCNSSSTSSLVSSPSITPYNTCFIQPKVLPSSEQTFHTSPMMPNSKPYAPCMLNMQPFYNPTAQPEKLAKCTKTKIYDCNLCPRSFARKHDLQRHIRVHTGAKPYYCLNCEKAFARTDALKRHLRMEETCRMSPVIQALKNVGMRRYRNL